jgi:hypothetical protein
MSVFCNQCCYSLKDYEILTKISADNDLEIDYFEENNEGSGDTVVNYLQLETGNTQNGG